MDLSAFLYSRLQPRPWVGVPVACDSGEADDRGEALSQMPEEGRLGQVRSTRSETGQSPIRTAAAKREGAVNNTVQSDQRDPRLANVIE